MNTNKVLVQSHVTPEVKEAAEKVFSDAGIDMATGIRIYLTKVKNSCSIPFSIETPNAETIRALEEGHRAAKDGYKGYKRYDSFKEILAELKAGAYDEI